MAAGRLKPGDVFCTVAFGGGYTSGAFVTRWDADPTHGARAASVDASTIVWFAPRVGPRWTWSLRRFVRTWTDAVAKSKLIGNSTLINISTKEATCLN